MTETTDPTARQLEQDRMYLENSRVEWDPVYLRAAGLRLLAALESLRRQYVAQQAALDIWHKERDRYEKGAEVALASLRRELEESYRRTGCECKCCDHGEGSDCGCDCHVTGLCSHEPLESLRRERDEAITRSDTLTARIVQVSKAETAAFERAEAAERERDEAYALGPHPIEQAQHIPLPQFIKTRFVPTWEFNEAVSRADAAEEALKGAQARVTELEAKIARLDLTIIAILRKLAIRINANDVGAIDAAKDVLRAILEELSPGTSLDDLLAVDDTTARRLLLFPHGPIHDKE